MHPCLHTHPSPWSSGFSASPLCQLDPRQVCSVHQSLSCHLLASRGSDFTHHCEKESWELEGRVPQEQQRVDVCNQQAAFSSAPRDVLLTCHWCPLAAAEMGPWCRSRGTSTEPPCQLSFFIISGLGPRCQSSRMPGSPCYIFSFFTGKETGT